MRTGWNNKRLIEVCDFQGGSQPPKEEWSKEPKPNYVRMLQIRDFTQSATDYIEYVKVSKSLKYCQDDDILLGRYGASVGKVLSGLSGAYNVAIIKAIPNIALVSKAYIKAYFLSPGFQLNLGKVSQHRAAQAGFSKDDIAGFPIPVPPIQEQEKIVAELDCLTGIIEKKRQQLEELDKLAQSIFYEMFGDPIANEKGWPYKSFGQLYDVKSSKRLYQNELSDRGVPFYKIADIVDLISGIKVVPISFVPTEKFSNLKQSGLVPQKGDILLTSRGTLGMCYIISTDEEFYFQDGMITWFSNGSKDMTPIFVKYLFKNNEYNLYLLKHGNYTTVAYISINQLKGMLCPIPPLDLQKEFVQKIEAIEKQKELVRRSIVETEILCNSRMDYWFN